MIRIRGTVEYADGRLVEFTTGPAAVAEWELYAARHGYPLKTDEMPALSSLVIAHYAIERTSEGFDTWRAQVMAVDAEVEGVPPSLTEVSAA